jgi:hypothetical protein
MTPYAQTALVNGAEPAQAPPRAALHVVRPSRGADLAAAEQAATAFLVALGVDLDTEARTSRRLWRPAGHGVPLRTAARRELGRYPGADGARVRRDVQVARRRERRLVHYDEGRAGIAEVSSWPDA